MVVGPPVARWNPGSDYKRPPPHREERHAAAELVWLAAAAEVSKRRKSKIGHMGVAACVTYSG